MFWLLNNFTLFLSFCFKIKFYRRKVRKIKKICTKFLALIDGKLENESKIILLKLWIQIQKWKSLCQWTNIFMKLILQFELFFYGKSTITELIVRITNLFIESFELIQSWHFHQFSFYTKSTPVPPIQQRKMEIYVSHMKNEILSLILSTSYMNNSFSTLKLNI